MKKDTFQKINFKAVLLSLFLICNMTFYAQATRLIPAGSIILDMGVVPQTVANGMKPYGLVYELVKNQKTPVIWSINSAKAKDGADFVVDGRSFKGSAFIIEKKYVNSTNVITAINDFKALGVITYTTINPVTVPFYKEMQEFPIWVVDNVLPANATTFQGYLNNASMPAASFVAGLPSTLTNCQDLFILPHSTPSWTVHNKILSWNDALSKGGNAGYMWEACLSVSLMEAVYNPADTRVRMNFLSKDITPITTATGPAPVAPLVPDNVHVSGAGPFSYAFPGDPFMQFMGTMDGAILASSAEAEYLPALGGGWNTDVFSGSTQTKYGATIAYWDTAHPNLIGGSGTDLSAGKAARIVYGYAFGDNSRGKIMYEGGHAIQNGTVAEYVAAQRAMLNFSFDAPTGKGAIIASNIVVPTAIKNGVTVSASISASSTYGGALTYQWTTNAAGGSFSAPTSATTNFTAPTLTAGQADIYGIISVAVTDSCGRQVFKTYELYIQAPPVAPVTNNDAASTYNTNPIIISPLSNDTDLNNNIDPATVAAMSALSVAGGVFAINSNGTISFVPTFGFVGTAILDYKVCDNTPVIDGGILCSNTSRITVTIASSPCTAGQILRTPTNYGTSVVGTPVSWTATTANSLGATNGNGSNSTAGAGAIIIDLGGVAMVGTQIQFRIYSTNASAVAGTIDASTTTTFPVAAAAVTTTTTATVAAPQIVTFNVTLLNTRYVRVTGANRFGLESVTYTQQVCYTPQDNLTIVKTASSMAPLVAQNVTFSLTASNLGPDLSFSTVATDLLPAGYTFVSATATQGTYNSGTGAWAIGSLDVYPLAAATAYLDIVATVNPAGPYANTATITSSVAETTPADNTTTITPVPVPQTNLSVLKTINNLTPYVGEIVTFTITASNAGPSPATAVVVNDLLTVAYTFVSATPSVGTYNSGTGAWTIGNLASSGTATLIITAIVNAAGQ